MSHFNPSVIQLRIRRLLRRGTVIVAASLALHDFAHANVAEPDAFPTPSELRGLSIEDLAELRITTVARRPEKLRDAPSAVSVVTAEDIRRGGATTIPEALRLAPGVHVARSNNNTWAVGVRGFNFTTSNKLLILRDGRSLYSPLFSGVFWDAQDTMIEDIERIEVNRGPGATLWGSNAVNGVINILTRNAKDTQGTLLTGGAGNREDGFAAARYGGKIGEKTWYRVYGRGWERDDAIAADGSEIDANNRFGQGGFRIDSEPRPGAEWSLMGELYDARFDQEGSDPIDLSGGHLLGKWTHTYHRDHRLNLQAYYDRIEREIPGTFGETRDTVDAEFDHRLFIADRHDLLWGANARISRDRIDNSASLAFLPHEETVRMFSAFIQDRISLVPDRLDLTLGSKFEHNSYSGFEVQPSARVAWVPEERQTVWAAISRAVRTPSRIDTDFFIFDQNGNTTIRGDRDFRSEQLYAYELGYRITPTPPLSLDFALFYHDYDHLRSLEGANPQVISNKLEGESYGGELSSSYRVSEWWRLKTGYAYLERELRAKSGSTDDPEQRGAEGNDPRHILFLQSTLNLGSEWALDGVVRHVSKLPNPSVPAYTELDLRAAYLFRKNIELSLVGRNLLDAHHREFGTTHAVPRTIFFRVRWDL